MILNEYKIMRENMGNDLEFTDNDREALDYLIKKEKLSMSIKFYKDYYLETLNDFVKVYNFTDEAYKRISDVGLELLYLSIGDVKGYIKDPIFLDFNLEYNTTLKVMEFSVKSILNGVTHKHKIAIFSQLHEIIEIYRKEIE